MKKLLASFFTIAFISQITLAQDNAIRPPAIGVSFFFNDFTTPQRIRTGSLSGVLREHQWAKFRDMSPGAALTYFDGVQKYIDFAGTLAVSFPTVPLPNKPNSSTTDAALLEADASFNFKLLPENYWFTPYAIAGVGGSKYKSYYGAFIPLGLGFKVNLFDEAALFISSQYRVPVTTETSNYHFMTSIGIAGIIGSKKQTALKVTE
jgi:OmpA-OmpF porin, OOP family